MKKILVLMVLITMSISAYAEDWFAYVSKVEHRSGYTVVTVTAKTQAFTSYNGFMVDVRPANHIFDLFITTDRAGKAVWLSKDKPSNTVIFRCDEDSSSRKACGRDDFIVKSRIR